MSGLVDYRSLVPREPPDGLWEWTLKNFGPELARCGLVYEVAYAEDYGIDYFLDIVAARKRIAAYRSYRSRNSYRCDEVHLVIQSVCNLGCSRSYGYIAIYICYLKFGRSYRRRIGLGAVESYTRISIHIRNDNLGEIFIVRKRHVFYIF